MNVQEFAIRLKDQTTATMGKVVSMTESGMGRFVRSVKMGEAEMEKFTAKAEGVKDKVGDTFRDLARGLAPFLTAFGVGALVEGLGELAIHAEQTKVQFEVLLGSGEKATTMIANLHAWADKTPFQFNDLAEASKTLLNFGVSAQNNLPVLKTLGDVSGGNAERLQMLAGAYGKVTAFQRLTGREMMEFIHAGWNPLRDISEATGISMEKLQKRMSKGEIGVNMVSAALEHATGVGGRFHDMLLKQSETLGGKWSTLKDHIHEVGLQAANALAPLLKNLVEFGEWLINNRDYIIGVAAAIGAYILVAQGATIATNIWRFAQLVLNTAMEMNPIGLIIAGIILLVFWIRHAWDHFGWFRGAVYGAWEALKGLGTLIKDFLVDSIVNFLKGILGLGQALVQFFKGDFSGAWETAKQATKDLIGVSTIQHAVDNAKKLGQNVAAGYNKGVKEVAGLHSKEGSTNPEKENGIAGAAFKFSKPGGEGSDTADGINKNGVRNIYINITKLVEKLEVHTVNMREGAEEIRELITEQFLRVVNSANNISGTSTGF
jgi:tape measure domain-containing protein